MAAQNRATDAVMGNPYTKAGRAAVGFRPPVNPNIARNAARDRAAAAAGARNPDPHNWAGIAAALAKAGAQGAVQSATPDWGQAGLDAVMGGAIGAGYSEPAYTPPPTRISGSGRSTGESTGMAAPPAVYAPPAQMTAPPAVVQPPAVFADANPSAVNTAGESFTSVGNPSTFGSYERRRQARGPKGGLSVTPEMIRRAAAQRLG